MDANRIDQISKAFSQRRLSRRRTLATGGAGFTAGVLAAAGLARATAAQDATPEPTTDGTTAAPAMLFVQSFQSGSIAPTEGTDGRYTVTLADGLGQTIYFSDRPERIVGTDPTARFLEGFPFPPDNPPNAALIMETGAGETDIAVVELFNPLYDPVTRGVTYEVEVLADWEDSLEMGFQEAPTDLAALAPSFAAAHLFIDDCLAEDITCSANTARGTAVVGEYDNQGMCYNYALCVPCEPYGHTQPDRCSVVKYWKSKCNSDFAACNNDCDVDWWGRYLLCITE
jgi:hypothetical protein